MKSKPKMSTKIRGHLITAVAWNQYNTSLTSTGPILMGTTRGLIFETEISTESTMFSTTGIEKQWKQLYDLGKGGQASAITGLEYHRVPNSKRFFIFVTTNSRLYQFQVKYRKIIAIILQLIKRKAGLAKEHWSTWKGHS